METEPGQKKHLFTNKQLWALLVPVVVEQILNSLMGTADTMMVSNVGSAAISAVSLVDSINVLVIQVFAPRWQQEEPSSVPSTWDRKIQKMPPMRQNS